MLKMLRFFDLKGNFRKAQGLPINTVILAALALVVLLVLFGILTGRIKWFGQGLATCPGECLTPERCSEIQGYSLGGSYLRPEQQRAEEGATCAQPSKNGLGSGEICCSARQDQKKD